MIAKFIGTIPADKRTNYALLALRIALAVVLVFHGYQKLAGGMDGFIAMLMKLSFPAPTLLVWIVALLEFVGGLAILIGLFTREFAILIAIQFIIILLYVKQLGFPASDTDILVLGAALALMFLGSGAWSIHVKVEKKKMEEPMKHEPAPPSMMPPSEPPSMQNPPESPSAPEA